MNKGEIKNIMRAKPKLNAKIEEKGLIAIGDISEITRDKAILFKDSDEYLYELNSSHVIGSSKSNPFAIINKYCLNNLNAFLEKNNKPYIAIGLCIDKREFVLKCKTCGHQLIAKSSYLVKYNVGCAKCSNRVKLTISGIQERIREKHPHIEVLSNDSDYKNCDSEIKCRCNIHNVIFYKKCDKINQWIYPCPECNSESKKGENNSSWKGGLTSLSSYVRNNLTDWWDESAKTTNFKCAVTGLSGDIEVHHLKKTFNEILLEALSNLELNVVESRGQLSDLQALNVLSEVSRLHWVYGLGLPLNKSIHKAFHVRYGFGDNTEEQFAEFLEYIKDEDVLRSILGEKDFKKIGVIKTSPMIQNCKKSVICNETGEVFESLAATVRKYGESEGITSSTLVNHLKRGSKFRKCKYTFKYAD